MSEIAIRPAANGTDHHAVCGTDNEPTARKCINCGDTKPLDEFARDGWKPLGRRNTCASCRTAYDREQDYIRRCRKYGHVPVVEHFTTQQLVERHGDRCIYCGGPFECIDHIVCVRVSGPHTLDNVVPCCRMCNQRKRWSVDEVDITAYCLLVAVACIQESPRLCGVVASDG